MCRQEILCYLLYHPHHIGCKRENPNLYHNLFKSFFCSIPQHHPPRAATWAMHTHWGRSSSRRVHIAPDIIDFLLFLPFYIFIMFVDEDDDDGRRRLRYHKRFIMHASSNDSILFAAFTLSDEEKEKERGKWQAYVNIIIYSSGLINQPIEGTICPSFKVSRQNDLHFKRRSYSKNW